MKISIQRVGDTIATYKEWKDIRGRGEIAHIMAELGVLRNELLTIWVNYDEIEENKENTSTSV